MAIILKKSSFIPANEATADFMQMLEGQRQVTEDMRVAASGVGAENLKAVLTLIETDAMASYASNRTALMHLALKV
jgi:hypothetical protein